MALTDSLKDVLTSPIGALSSAVGAVATLGHLTGAELFNVLTANAGTWFSAVAVSATTVAPNLGAVLDGTASTATTAVVVAGAAYVAILADRLLDRIEKAWKDT